MGETGEGKRVGMRNILRNLYHLSWHLERSLELEQRELQEVQIEISGVCLCVCVEEGGGEEKHAERFLGMFCC